MDRLVWTASAGARQLVARQDATAGNLANAATPGYRAVMSATRAVPVEGAPGSGKLETRAFALESTSGPDLTPGAIQRTGRALDVAIEGEGWFAVQGPDGREAYTRNGSFDVGASGILETRSGLAVIGEGGPISIPPDHSLSVARDGTVSAFPNGQPPTNVVNVGRLKLVNPAAASIQRGEDGLFRLRSGQEADADPSVAVAGESLEGSNVNAAQALVGMVALARQFEMHMKLLTQAEDNARKASSLLSMNG